MGGTQSITEAPVFEPILTKLDRPLNLSELWALPIPQCAKGIDLKDIAVLFKMDGDRDGGFGCSDIVEFAEMVNLEARDVAEQHLGDRIIGLCGLEFVKTLETRSGIDGVIDWAHRVLGVADEPYIPISQVKVLLLMFDAADILPDLLRAVARHGSEAQLVETREIRESFLKPLLQQYCDMMTHMGVGNDPVDNKA